MTRLPSQNDPWLAVLPHDSVPALGHARLCPGIEVAATADELWLRGPGLTPEIVGALKGVSGLEWREPLPENRWRHPGDLLPGGTLPLDLSVADWRPLSRALVPDTPELVIAEPFGTLLPFRVLPGGPEHPANLLIIPLCDFSAWAESAPEVRLNPLRFAVNADGLALIHGIPLPPLHGEAWWESGGIALPCGFHLEPDLSPATVRASLGIPPASGALTLFHESGKTEQIPGEAIVPVNRASLRMSAALCGTV